MNVNTILAKLHSAGLLQILRVLIYVMYRIKGKKIKSVRFLRELNVWEFKIDNDFFYSAGAGWAYDYGYLLRQFKHNLGFHYMPKEGDVVVDVGAGLGEEVMIFSKSVGEHGKVFAIEAHPTTFKALQFNCKQNGFRNVIPLNIAIADAPGFIYIQDSAHTIANKVSKEYDEGSLKVEATTIEKLVDRYNISQINFLKVNIEGAESLLIKGIGSAITKIENMAISCHDFRYEKEKDEFFKTKAIVLNFLRENNFDCVVRDTNEPLLDDYIYAVARR